MSDGPSGAYAGKVPSRGLSFLDWFEEPHREHLEAELRSFLSLADYVERHLPAPDSRQDEALFERDHAAWVLYARAREAVPLMRTFVAAVREAVGQYTVLQGLTDGLSDSFLVLDEVRHHVRSSKAHSATVSRQDGPTLL